MFCIAQASFLLTNRRTSFRYFRLRSLESIWNHTCPAVPAMMALQAGHCFCLPETSIPASQKSLQFFLFFIVHSYILYHIRGGCSIYYFRGKSSPAESMSSQAPRRSAYFLSGHYKEEPGSAVEYKFGLVDIPLSCTTERRIHDP